MSQTPPEARSENTPSHLRMLPMGDRFKPGPEDLAAPPGQWGLTTTTTPPPAPMVHPTQANAAWKQGFVGALNAVMLVTAARMIVLVAVLGGIGLTWLTLLEPNPYKLGALGIYAVAIVGSAVWLAGR